MSRCDLRPVGLRFAAQPSACERRMGEEIAVANKFQVCTPFLGAVLCSSDDNQLIFLMIDLPTYTPLGIKLHLYIAAF